MEPEALKDLPRSERIETLFSFSAFDYQRDLIDKADDKAVFKAAVKPGRQVGKTVTGGAIAAERALSGHDVMILGPFEDTVGEMMEAAQAHLRAAEDKLSEAGVALGTTQRNKYEWQFEGDGRLRARTVGTDGTQIRGKNPDVVLIDEDAYIKERIHTEVIEPFFSTHDEYEFYLFSTPAGKSGYFYEKVEHDDGFYSPHWPSRISPLIDDDFLEDKRRELDAYTYQQEYLGEFVDEGDTFLNHQHVTDATQSTIDLDGRLWLGVDVARKGKDRTVYCVIDEHATVEIVAAEDTSTIPGIVGRIKRLHADYGFERVLVDENAVGGGVVDDEELTEMGIMHGVTFSTKSKHEMYNRLKSDFENGALTIPTDRRLVDELTSLQFDVTGNGYYKVYHPDGGHDDHADALALANWGRSGVGQATVNRRKARVNMQRRDA